MEGIAACFEDLMDPRTGNAGRHDLVEIMVIALCTVLCGGQCFGHGDVRAGKGSVSSTILEARKGIAEPRHLLSGVPPPRSGTVQRLLPKVHGQVLASLPRRHRHRRQGVASLLRQGQRQVTAPHGFRLGLRSAPRAGADRHGRQVERDHRRSAIVEALVAKGYHRDRRRAQLSARDRPAKSSIRAAITPSRSRAIKARCTPMSRCSSTIS
jgi:hypothetical protein